VPSGGRIDVTAKREAHADGARIVFTVADTGAGIAGAPGVCGIGLANIRERLALLYGERAALETDANAPRGFVARLVLPLERLAARTPVAESASP
jgi:sensor histidine kinase YesM